jgi:HSP20 family molecular chaperone IbpA
MKNEAIPPVRNVAIQQVSFDCLLNKTTEWSNRIAKRAYEIFAGSGFTNGHDQQDWLKAERELLEPLALKVRDGKAEFILTAKVPGFDAKDLEININGSHLVIEGEHETAAERKGRGSIHRVHNCRQIYRMIELPARVVSEKVHAELKQGVLEIKLPKAEKPREIAANVAA